MDNTEHGITVAYGWHNNAEGDQVMDLFKFDLLFDDLFMNRADVFQATLDLSEAEQEYTNHDTNDWKLAASQVDGDQNYDSSNNTLTFLGIGDVVRDNEVNYEWEGSGPLVALEAAEAG